MPTNLNIYNIHVQYNTVKCHLLEGRLLDKIFWISLNIKIHIICLLKMAKIIRGKKKNGNSKQYMPTEAKCYFKFNFAV